MSSNREAALHILRRLRDANHTAYFAGGCVRDALLNLPPKDHDIATSASPADVRKLFRNTQAVGAAFGVILVRHGGHQIEVATFRSDGSYSDGRRPDQIRFATPEEDALRRDFTINGLFEDPLPAPNPTPPPTPNTPPTKIIDYVGGIADLSARVLRAIGDPDRRFAEDHLRLLRAVRFAARFNLTLDPPTATAIKRNAPHLRRIAPERVGDELRRILTAPSRNLGWSLLRSLHLTPELFRYLPCAELPTLSLFPFLPDEPLSFPLSLAAAILEETTPPPAPATPRESQFLSVLTPPAISAADHALRQSLRLSNDESTLLTSILTWTATLLSPPSPQLPPPSSPPSVPPCLGRSSDRPPASVPSSSPPLSTLRRFLASPAAPDTLTLLHTFLRANLFTETLTPLLPHLANLSTLDNAPPPLLTGDHLTAAGLKPGPLFRKLLESTYNAQLEGHLSTPESALQYALAQLP